MKPLRFALAPAFTVMFALPALADRLPLSVISDYLGGLDVVRAEFTQTNDDGSTSQGTLSLERPGKLRLEYAGSSDLVIAAGGQVAVFDSGSNEPPQRFPANRTPLNLILRSDVDLTQARMVVAHTEREGDTVVRAQDPAHPEYGSIDLIFSATPVLKAWVVHDEGGGQTTVQLTRMQLGGNIPDNLFNIRSEASRRGTPID